MEKKYVGNVPLNLSMSL